MEICSQIKVNIIKQIGNGQGRNSEVYLAYDPQLDGEVALKVIPLASFRDPSEYYREAKIIYQNRSPRVVPIQYACCGSDSIRIVMPYFQNGSLQDRLDQGPLTTRQLIVLSDQFLNGVHHVHSQGYIHFDIKPTNILINNDQSALLADFGQTMPVNALGVANIPPLYCCHFPPEACDYRAATKQADLYQVGLTLYRMCNGNKFYYSQAPSVQNPIEFDALRDLIRTSKFPRRDLFLPHVPTRLRTIIRKLLKIDPAQRYQTALDLKNDLGQIAYLLDWQYQELTNGIRWSMTKEGHIHEIILLLTSKTNWTVEGYTIRESDGVRRRKNHWFGGPFRTFKKATEFVSGLFRQMEG